jgi:hypothetical protein
MKTNLVKARNVIYLTFLGFVATFLMILLLPVMPVIFWYKHDKLMAEIKKSKQKQVEEVI